MAEVTRRVIEAAYLHGNCVIVGRGAQCVLQDRADTLHIFIYAPQCERIARVRQRVPAENKPEELIRSMDRQRSEYIRIYFGCNWSDPHLYHMLISSEVGEDEVASIIIETIEGSENRRA